MSLKLNIGAGGGIKPGWRNMDITFEGSAFVDIEKMLPFADNSVDQLKGLVK
jgi:predicted SAM-dependent methyltransferase